MEFKGTNETWFRSGTEIVSMPSQVKIAKVSGRTYEEAIANALLISKAPILLEEHQKEVEFLKSLLAKIEKYSLDNNAWDLDSNIKTNLIEDRIKHLEHLIKKATEIQP